MNIVFSLPLTYEPADMIASSPILTNDSPPTILTAPPLLNDNEIDVILNNLPSPSDDTPALIKTDPPAPLPPELTTIILDLPAPENVTPVKTLPLSSFAEIPLFALIDVVLL